MINTDKNLTDNGHKQVAQTSLQLLPLIMNNIPQAVFWKDQNLVYLGCNQAFVEDAGFASPEDIIGKTDFDMPWKDQAELYRADDRRVLDSGEPKLNYEEPQTTPSGSVTWLRTSKIPVYENDRIVAILGMYEDVTKQKETEAFLRSMVENAPEAVGIIDLNTGLFTDPNENALKLYGMSPEELIKVGPADMSPTLQPDGCSSAEKAMEMINRTLRGESPVFEWVHRNAQGKEIPCEIRLMRLPGNLPRIRFSATDITTRKRAEEVVENERQRFQTILETVRVPTIISRLSDGIVLYANQAIAQVSQVHLEELIGFKTGNFYANPEDQTKIREALRTSGHIEDFEVQFQRSDGSLYWALLSSRIINYEGETCILSTYVDITERRQAEQALKAHDEFSQKQSSVFAELARRESLYSGDIQAAFAEVTEAAVKTLDIQRSSIWYYNEAHTEIRCMDLFEQGKGHSAGITLSKTDFPAYFKALEDEKIIAADNAHTHPATFEFSASYLTPLGINSMLDAPIRLRGQVIGVICNEHVGPFRQWTREEQNFAGTIVDFVTVAVETQERKQAEEAVHENEERFRRFTEATVEGLIFHERGTIIDVNPAAVTMIGSLDVKDLIGKNLLEFIAPEFHQLVLEKMQSHTVLPYEIQCVRTDGSSFPVETSTRAYQVGNREIRASSMRDITERKRAEESLRQSESKLSSALYVAKMGHWEFDIPTQMFTFNDQYYALHGTNAQAVGGYQMSVQRFAQEFVHPEDAATVGQATQQAIETTDPNFQVQIEARILRTDGELRWVTVWFRVEKDARGRTIKLHGVNQDITERKQAEQALRENQQLLQLVMDNIPQAVFWKDRNLSYLGVNQSFAEDAGYSSPQELVGKNDFDMPWKEQAELYRADDQRVFDLGETKLNYEEPQTSPTGNVTWLRTSKIPMRDVNGQIFAVLGMYEDITERKQAESALRQEQALSDAIINGLPGVFYLFDTQGKMLRWNKQYEQVLGYTAEETAARTALDPIADKDKERVLAAIQRVFTEGQATVEGEFTTKDGRNLPYYFAGQVLQVGDQVYLAGTGIDISERKRLEAQVQEAFERRGLQVKLSTQVSQSIAAASSLGELYERVVSQVKEQFGYYHTQLLRYDATQDAVVLVTGYGETGAKMLAAGHRLPMGEGLIGTAAAAGETVLRPALENDPDWHPNPLLPETKGEIAVPIKLGDTTLGVLDVQSNVANALNADDQLLLEGLCGQIAIAIESTRLREDMSERLEEINRLYRAMSQEGWKTYRGTTDVPAGFMYDQSGLRTITEPGLAEELFASVPLAVPGGEVIGTLAIAEDPQRVLSPEDEVFLEQVSEQVALALESARLFEQTQEALNWQQAINHTSIMIGQAKGVPEITRAVAELLPLLGMASCSINVIKEIENGVPILSDTHIVRFENNQFESRPPLLNLPTAGWLPDDQSYYQKNRVTVFPDLDDLTTIVPPDAYQAPDAVAYMRKVGIHSAIALALGVTQRPIGYLTFTSWSPLTHIPDTYITWLGTIVDLISTAIDSELLLNETEQARQSLGEVMTVAGMANWELNLETFVFTYNDRLYQMLGTTAEEEGGYQMSAEKYVGTYIHPDDAALIMGAIQAGIQSPDPQNYKGSLEYRMIRKDGDLRYMLTDYRLVVNEQGKPVAGVGSFLDITERKLAELTVARRAEELKTVAAVSTTASSVLDPDKLLQEVVDLTKERFSLYHAHIYTFDESWNTLLLAAGAGEVGRKLVAEEHAIPLALEQSLVARAARERKHVIINDVNAEPGFLPNPLLPETCAEMAIPMTVGDKLLGVFDVQSSHANGFSDEDASIYVTLAAQVGVALQNARSYAEQAALVTQLRELDRLKSSFLANMSHELRTPLNSILGFADVIIEELDGPLTENMTNDLRLIQKNGQHLLHLINDVLDMAKIEAGRMNLNPEKFTAFEVIEEVTSITSTLASEKNLALFIEPDSDQNVKVFADRTRLRQVMINLVNNAIKFTENGKISLKLAALEGARILFTIKDTGIGIPPDKLEAIFQEFTQVDSSTTRKVGGTGLGLPISRRLVEMHGGRLWAESTGVSGEGSTFFVELPVEARITETVEKQAK